MSAPEVGKPIIGDAYRDAIHVAIAPAKAKAWLEPGTHVDVDGGTTGKLVGIVDPFLTTCLSRGQSFYIFLYPNTVTSLRHEWTHPDFAVEVANGPSVEAPVGPDERWLRAYADQVDIGYGKLMDAADAWLETHDGKWGGEYLNMGGHLEGRYVPEEFWDHYDKVRAVTTPEEKRGSFFTCSC